MDNSEKQNNISEENKEALKELMPDNIYDFIRFFLTALVSQSWVYMGLIYNPRDNQITKDLTQAKVAIDCFEFLFNKIKDKLTEKETKELQEILANLQLNFIEKTGS